MSRLVRRQIAVILILMLGLSVCAFAVEPAQPGANPLALLDESRYAELDQMMAAVQAGYKQGSTTDEQLLAAFRPFYAVEDPGRQRHYDEWVQQRPKSYVARLVRGIHHKYVGLKARGDGSISVTTQPQLDARDAAFELAAVDLKASISLDEKPLLTYLHMMDLGAARGLLVTERSLLNDANALDPGNFIVKRKFLMSLRSRWGGNIDKMRKFVEDCRHAGLTAAQMRELEDAVVAENAYLHYQKQEYAEAVRLYDGVLANNPSDQDSARFRVTSLMQLDRCKETIVAATELLQNHPDDASAFTNRGICYRNQDNGEAAVRDFQHASDMGDPWAQKELAREYWQGRYIKKDRDLALKWLRKSAEQGDADAQRELKRVTGVQIVTPPRGRHGPSWASLARWTASGFAIVFLLRVFETWKVARGSARSPYFRASAGRPQLSVPVSTLVVGAIRVVLFAGAAVASNLFPDQSASVSTSLYTTLAFLVFAATGLPGVAGYFLLRHELLEEGLRYGRLIGGGGSLKWREVTQVQYSRLLRRFTLRTPSGPAVHIGELLVGIPEFAQHVLERVPHTAIDEKTLAVLKEIALGDYDEANLDDGDDEPGERPTPRLGT